jgi:hypothetical protein
MGLVWRCGHLGEGACRIINIRSTKNSEPGFPYYLWIQLPHNVISINLTLSSISRAQNAAIGLFQVPYGLPQMQTAARQGEKYTAARFMSIVRRHGLIASSRGFTAVSVTRGIPYARPAVAMASTAAFPRPSAKNTLRYVSWFSQMTGERIAKSGW